jgi:hypothetical protein
MDISEMDISEFRYLLMTSFQIYPFPICPYLKWTYRSGHIGNLKYMNFGPGYLGFPICPYRISKISIAKKMDISEMGISEMEISD